MVRKKFSRKGLLIGFTWTLIVIVVLTFYIWNQIESIRLGYRISDLEENLQAIQKDVDKLEARKSSLLALDRVERIARKKLKLEKPKKEQIVYDGFKPLP